MATTFRRHDNKSWASLLKLIRVSLVVLERPFSTSCKIVPYWPGKLLTASLLSQQQCTGQQGRWVGLTTLKHQIPSFGLHMRCCTVFSGVLCNRPQSSLQDSHRPPACSRRRPLDCILSSMFDCTAEQAFAAPPAVQSKDHTSLPWQVHNGTADCFEMSCPQSCGLAYDRYYGVESAVQLCRKATRPCI
jgi:hypothetical protein